MADPELHQYHDAQKGEPTGNIDLSHASCRFITFRNTRHPLTTLFSAALLFLWNCQNLYPNYHAKPSNGVARVTSGFEYSLTGGFGKDSIGSLCATPSRDLFLILGVPFASARAGTLIIFDISDTPKPMYTSAYSPYSAGVQKIRKNL